MSADESNIPVSLEFFKKCTYYEEIVMKIIKSKTLGNAEKFKKFLESKAIKQNALYNYYRAFYLQPEIRKKHPIRMKPMPQKKRIKLLQLPNTQSTKSNDSNIESGKDFVSAGNEQNMATVCCIKEMNAAKLTKQSVGEELIVEDDAMRDEGSNEPHRLTKLSGKKILERKFKLNSTNETQRKEKENIALETDVTSEQKSRKRTVALSVEEQPSAKLLKSAWDCNQIKGKEEKEGRGNNNKNFESKADDSVKQRYSSNIKYLKAPGIKTDKSTAANDSSSHARLREKEYIANLLPVTTASVINDSLLRKFAHHCPVTLREFENYTNIKKVVRRSRENNTRIKKERVPYLCRKIYLIYYLCPQFRHSSAIMKQLNFTTNCPDNVKERLFQVPLIKETNKNEQINGGYPEEIHGSETCNKIKPSVTEEEFEKRKKIFVNKNSHDARADLITYEANPESPDVVYNNTFINSGNNLVDAKDGNRKKIGLEILENRLLPNVNLELKSSMQVPPKNSSCKFCQVSFEDFKARTNVLKHVQADDDQALKDVYIHFMQLDEEFINHFTAVAGLMFTLFKCPHVCTDCEQKWISHSILNKQSCEARQKTSLERRIEQVQKSPKTVCTVTKPAGYSEIECNPNSLSQQVLKDNETPEQTKDSSMVKLIHEKCKSSKEFKNSFNTPCPNVTNATTEIHKDNDFNHENSLHMVLSNNEWFNEFRCLLLKKLQEPFDYSLFPVTIETFKKCSMYLEPLYQILWDFCGPDVNLVNRLFENKELCDNLLLYYYRKYFTFSNLRNKYPLKLKICPASWREKMLAFVNGNEGNSNAQEKVIIWDDKVTIKTEPGQISPLRCLKFVKNSDGKLECMLFEKEIVNLDNSNAFQRNNEADNLPSQIMFDEHEINSKPQNTPNKFSGDLISSGRSGSTFCLAQRLPTYCHLSERHHDSSGCTQSSLPCFATQNDIKKPPETLKGMDNGIFKPLSPNQPKIEPDVPANKSIPCHESTTTKGTPPVLTNLLPETSNNTQTTTPTTVEPQTPQGLRRSARETREPNRMKDYAIYKH